MYTSASSPGIKIVRAILYALIFISSIGLIVTLTDVNTIQSELVKTGRPFVYLDPDPAYPSILSWPGTARPTAAIETGRTVYRVEKREHHRPQEQLVDVDVNAVPISGTSVSTSAPTPIETYDPHKFPHWKTGRTEVLCTVYDRKAIKFIAITALVTAICVAVATFVLPTLGGTFLGFLSFFGVEALFSVLLFVLWAVLTGFATKEAIELGQCSCKSRIAPLLLRFAWLGGISSLLLATGFLIVSVVENSRGNKKIWTSRFQDFVFGEKAIQLPSDGLASPPGVASG